MSTVVTDRKTVDEVINSFARTTDEVFTLDGLRRLLLSGRQLRMKYGVDVTAPSMHIGHAVNLWMYRKLQELGHKLVFLIGDFTTQIGDPTGKNKTRPIIPIEEIEKNSKAFIEQAKMVVHDNPDLIEVRKNSEWFESMPTKRFIGLLQMVTHDRLISRDMFRKRIEGKQEIYMHELVYPVIQGYDSVALEADIAIIGSDQLYNEMLGRLYQEKFGQFSQVILTTKITPGIDGKEKQSKSLNNYVGLGHTPREKFGRIMSMPDSQIVEYLEVYTDVVDEEIDLAKHDVDINPMKWKLFLAAEIVARYHGREAAQDELKWFKETFSQGKVPDEIDTIIIGANSLDSFSILRKCLSESEFSNSEIRRLFAQGAIKFDGLAINDIKQVVDVSEYGVIIKVGKRKWFKAIP